METDRNTINPSPVSNASPSRKGPLGTTTSSGVPTEEVSAWVLLFRVSVSRDGVSERVIHFLQYNGFD